MKNDFKMKASDLRAFIVIAVSLIGLIAVTLVFSATKASASAKRLYAIERVKGLHEVKHRKAIQAMVGVNPRRVPWCGAAVAYAVRKAGQRPVKHHLSARAWKRFGKPVRLSQARKGDIVVYRFRRGYHVAVFKGRAGKGRHVSCGGNMSNRFKCSIYRNGSVKAVRR